MMRNSTLSSAEIDILVCTPLKFLKAFKYLNLTNLQYIIMDECDKYFELVLIFF